MIIERLIDDFGKGMSKILFNKEKDKDGEKVDLENLDSNDTLLMLLKRLIYKGEYNKAEDLLFKELEKSKSNEIYNIGVKFYNLMLERSDEELEKGDFSRDEIYRGLEDMKMITDKHIESN